MGLLQSGSRSRVDLIRLRQASLVRILVNSGTMVLPVCPSPRRRPQSCRVRRTVAPLGLTPMATGVFALKLVMASVATFGLYRQSQATSRLVRR